MFLKRIFILASILFAANANADIMFQLTSSFHSREVNSSGNESIQEHHMFLGMPIAVKEQLYFGLNVSYTKAEGGTYFDSMEYGPRINYYINSDKTFLIMLAYNFLSGSQHAASGNTTNGDDSVNGTAMLAGLGYEFKVNSNFYIGASLVYHSTTYEDKSGAAAADIKITSINPGINFGFRFR
jgi:hypothetical protein